MAIIKLVTILNRPILKKTKPSINLKGYELFYTDQKTEKKIAGVTYSELLVSKKYGIKGKPDFVYKKKNDVLLIPIELKSGKIGEAAVPRAGDLMQLVAYFIILEEVYGVKPKVGRLIYSDFMFIIRNTYGQKRKLLNILTEMREMLETGEQTVEPSFTKCKYCVCRDTVCEYCEE